MQALAVRFCYTMHAGLRIFIDGDIITKLKLLRRFEIRTRQHQQVLQQLSDKDLVRYQRQLLDLKTQQLSLGTDLMIMWAKLELYHVFLANTMCSMARLARVCKDTHVLQPFVLSTRIRFAQIAQRPRGGFRMLDCFRHFLRIDEELDVSDLVYESSTSSEEDTDSS